ncbi:MAG: hypothetical protein A2511_12865 [Deltaproteobacteria bacterium RIFOXYD12_FULL_50_9]|nr:MAG: hypothetical protein A2511_12865 [Deltaproteobacteria bacterium RIFOXYD12_FULL_50_9]
MIRKHRTLFIACLSLLLLSVKALFPNNCRAAEVLIIGDITLKPVVDVVAGIRETLPSAFTVISPSDETGRLAEIVAREGARTVIALGNDAIKDALQLPANIAVIYDLVVLPPKYDRPNTTGMYMGTPVVTYLNFITKHLPSLKKISVISSPQTMEILGGIGFSQVASHQVTNSFDFINTVKQLNSGDALLLLPDLGLLTATAVEETYLFSFRAKIPILGLSEKHVRQGALFALVFDPVSVGRMLGERAAQSLAGADIGQIPPAPSTHFDLYVNRETARKMGITIPDAMFKMAKAVFP